MEIRVFIVHVSSSCVLQDFDKIL